MIPSSVKARHLRRLRADAEHIRTIRSYKKAVMTTPPSTPESRQKLWTMLTSMALKKTEMIEKLTHPVLSQLEQVTLERVGNENEYAAKMYALQNVALDLASSFGALYLAEKGNKPEGMESVVQAASDAIVPLIFTGIDLLTEGLKYAGVKRPE